MQLFIYLNLLIFLFLFYNIKHLLCVKFHTIFVVWKKKSGKY
jgi:hypothetical protein